MTSQQFAEILTYLQTTIGKNIVEGTGAAAKAMAEARSQAYWDLLKDVPVDVMRMATKKVCLSHQWASFPSVAELRGAVADVVTADVAIPPAEAFQLAWRAASKIDPDIQGPYMARNANGEMQQYQSQTAYVMDSLPPLVARALRNFGIRAMATGNEPTGVVRAQFLKAFEAVVAKHRQLAIIPAELRAEIEAQGMPSLVSKAAQGIGVEK